MFTSIFHGICRYAFVLHCWKLQPDERPSFSNLVDSLSQSIDSMAGYMDVFAFHGREYVAVVDMITRSGTQ